MITKQNRTIAPVKIALFIFGVLAMVSFLVCWLIGLVTYQVIGLCLIGSGIMALLFAAYGFMGESALDCDDRVRFSSLDTSTSDQTIASPNDGMCINQMALGIGGGGVLTIVAGIVIFMVAG